MISPKGKLVLIKPDAVADTYGSGLLKTTKQKSNSGIVLKVSPDWNFQVKEGDRVYFLNNHAEEVEDGLLVRADEDGAILFVYNQ